MILEEGTNRYDRGKYQSIKISCFILKNDEYLESEAESLIKLPVNQKSNLIDCYVIGTDGFKKRVSKAVNKNTKWECITKYQSEDIWLKNMNLSFPKVVIEETKQAETSELVKKVHDMINDLWKDFTDEEIVGILLAADDLQSMKIYPMTDQNLHDAFFKTACVYIHNETRALAAVDRFLQVNG